MLDLLYYNHKLNVADSIESFRTIVRKILLTLRLLTGFFIFGENMNDTHIDVGLHHYTHGKFRHYVYDDQRVCFYLKREDESFVDSLDIDYLTGRIRFYGSMKDYSINRIPQAKKKLWNCANFRQFIIERLTNAITKSSDWKAKLYQESLDGIVKACVK